MASRLSPLTEDTPKWKIALAIAAPVAVGVAGVMWYKNRQGKKAARGEVGAEGEAVTPGDAPPGLDANASPFDKAIAAKNKGNKYFKGGKYDKAIECYTEAIKICPENKRDEIATFYQNRAAAYEQLKNNDQVIKDCTEALNHNSRYCKALTRRAKACERTGDLMQCLEDVTALCILENFGNQQSLLIADRVLKELGKKKAEENYKTRGPVEPSKQFIRTYFSTFCNDPIQKDIEEAKTSNRKVKFEEKDEQGEIEKGRDETPEKEKVVLGEGAEAQNNPSHYQQAIKEISENKIDNVVSLCTKEISDSSSPNIAKAYLLRATFHHLRGEGSMALDDLNKLLELNDVDVKVRSNALIKRGSLKMQNGEQEAALKDFKTAIDNDPNNSDIYHHRGQLNLLTDGILEAVADFQKSVDLSPNFAIANLQKCYTDYRAAFMTNDQTQLIKPMAAFEAAIKKFPDCSEGYALYGQALADQQEFPRAEDAFSKGIELEPDNGNIYVHKGLLYLQWKSDVEKASKLMNEALKVDDKCEFAYQTLGTIEVQRGNLDRSIELFKKAISLVRTEIEMAHLYSLLDAAIAQSRVAQRFGIQVPMAAGMV